MAERIDPLREESKNPSFDSSRDPISQVKADIENLVENFDLRTVLKKVEDFGHANPVGLALTALTFGVTVGVMMRKTQSEKH